MKRPEVTHQISAIILAAGMSRRMGRPKMTLPWGDTTVLGQVIQVLKIAGLDDILVVTGGARRQVEAESLKYSVRTVFNRLYQRDQMTLSLQTGIQNIGKAAAGVLVALGDQPQIEVETVMRLLQAAEETQESLLIPSYQMRRGHPWIIKRELWRQVLDLPPEVTLREMLNAHTDKIHYVPVANGSIFLDLDTPQDYQTQEPRQ
jgi:molybdenum cofactor cytidylyltransferase